MNVMVATDGHVPPRSAARFAASLAGAGGSITVLTVVEVPRSLLADLRRVYGEQPAVSVDEDAEYVGVQARPASTPTDWPGDDAMLQRFLDDQREARTAELVAELEAADLEYRTEAVESENPARAVLDAAAAGKADVLIIGSHGRGRFEGLLGSTGTKITRLAPCPVLILRDR